LKEKWVDYVAPQLYLEIGHDKIDYAKMLEWWSKNSYGRNLYIGSVSIVQEAMQHGEIPTNCPTR
jgi:hypothetical protein